MRSLFLLALLAFLPAAAADDYHVDVGLTESEGYGTPAPTSSCANASDAKSALTHDAREVWDGSMRWGLPYSAPDCLAFDTRTTFVPSGAHGSYDLATGGYYVDADGLPQALSGKSGVYVKINCEGCPPPWEGVLP